MKKIFLITFLSITLFACKSRKNISETENIISLPDSINTEKKVVTETIKPEAKVEDKKMYNTYLKAVNDHYAINKDFSTLQINADVDFLNNSLEQSFSADIRIQKGETILISLKKFGITGAKVLITPDRVSYYESLTGTHYDGNFSFLSDFLGTDLNYNKVENLLIGTSIFDLAEEELTTKVEDGVYKLYKEDDKLSLIFVLDGLARMKQEVINQKGSTDKLVIDYLTYQTENQIVLPKDLLIRAMQKHDTNLKVQYKKVNVNPNISFPYNIPNGSKAIKF